MPISLSMDLGGLFFEEGWLRIPPTTTPSGSMSEELPLSSLLAADAELSGTLQSCVHALRLLADNDLPPKLADRMHALGENKEFLSQPEREELSALVDLWRQRTVEKLEAQVALKRLEAKFPALFVSP